MALMICPECGKDVSNQAEVCPNCGLPLSKYLKEREKREKKVEKASRRTLSNEELEKAISSKKGEAEACIEDEEKFERLIQRLEKKLGKIPGIGKNMGDIVCAISLVRSYMQGEYREIPVGSIVGIVSALVYIVSPVDLIPDAIPGIGFIDDAAVIGFALKNISNDIEDYRQWRKKNGKEKL